MTTLNEAKEAAYQQFISNYNGVPLERIVFDDEAPPDDKGGSWVRVSVKNRGRKQETMGKKTNRRFKSAASVFVQVYTETDKGVKQSDTLATEAADVFEGESFSGLDFREAVIRETGPDGKWYQELVEAEFDYYEIK